MKYLVLLLDGMADYPVPELEGKTPMEVAFKPNIDSLALKGEVGLCKTVANGLKPGSDVANLSVLGYDPKVCYTGRSPLEAASIGIELEPTDVAMRCNLVTLSEEKNFADRTMVDYCADDIYTEEAAKLVEYIEEKMGNDIYRFYSGVSYRHCLVIKNGTTELGNMTPPHDISGRVIGEYLSQNENAKPLLDLMEKSYDLLKDHPVNIERVKNGKRPANSIWLWGEGRKPSLEDFKVKNGISGAIVSAVDLLRGIGKCANMQSPEVLGVTGYIDTDFTAKKDAAINLFEEGNDLVYTKKVGGVVRKGVAYIHNINTGNTIKNVAFEENDNKRVYTCVLTNIDVENYAVDYCVRSYIIFSKPNEKDIILYGDVYSITVKEVAETILATPGADAVSREASLSVLTEYNEFLGKNQLFDLENWSFESWVKASGDNKSYISLTSASWQEINLTLKLKKNSKYKFTMDFYQTASDAVTPTMASMEVFENIDGTLTNVYRTETDKYYWTSKSDTNSQNPGNISTTFNTTDRTETYVLQFNLQGVAKVTFQNLDIIQVE